MSKFIKNQVPHNFKDITGHVFGDWVVLSKTDFKKNNQILWLCKNIDGSKALKKRGNLILHTKKTGKIDKSHWTRTTAKDKGLTRYFNGKPCPNGHVAERMTSNARCVECLKIYKKRPDNVLKELERLKKDRENNPEKYKQIRIKRCKIPRNRLDMSLRQRLVGCLKEKYKSKNFTLIFGYSLDDLKIHLERQFIKGMSWDNYGDWHVDHIIPVSHFSYKSIKDEDFKACWALTNLRPLWAKENYKKSSIRTHLL